MTKREALVPGWTLPTIDERDYDVQSFTPNHPGFTTPEPETTSEVAAGSFSSHPREQNKKNRSLPVLNAQGSRLNAKLPELKVYGQPRMQRKQKSMYTCLRQDSDKPEHDGHTVIKPHLNFLSTDAKSLSIKPERDFNTKNNSQSVKSSGARKETDKDPCSQMFRSGISSTNPALRERKGSGALSIPPGKNWETKDTSLLKIDKASTSLARPTILAATASDPTTSNAAKRADADRYKARDSRPAQDMFKRHFMPTPVAGVREVDTSESHSVSATSLMTISLPGSGINLLDGSFCPNKKIGADSDGEADHRAVINNIYQRISQKKRANSTVCKQTSGTKTVPADYRQSIPALPSASSSSSSRYRRPSNVTAGRNDPLSRKRPDFLTGGNLADLTRPADSTGWQAGLRWHMPTGHRRVRAQNTSRKLGTLRSDHRPETLCQQTAVGEDVISCLGSTSSTWLHPPRGLCRTSSFSCSARGRSRGPPGARAIGSRTLLLPVVDLGNAMEHMVHSGGRSRDGGACRRPPAQPPMSRWLP